MPCHSSELFESFLCFRPLNVCIRLLKREHLLFFRYDGGWMEFEMRGKLNGALRASGLVET
jgi:hypothetical protein